MSEIEILITRVCNAVVVGDGGSSGGGGVGFKVVVFVVVKVEFAGCRSYIGCRGGCGGGNVAVHGGGDFV